MWSCSLGPDAELRLLEERHAEELFALTDRNRAYLREWMPWVDPTRTADDTRKFIRGTMEQFARNDGFVAGLWHAGRIAGSIGLHKVDWGNGATSLGYWVSADLQGKGLATRASRAIVDHAFRELKLNRMEIRCGVENKKSRRIPEKLGFKLEGVARQAEKLYDRFIDVAVYSMLASEHRPGGEAAERSNGRTVT